LHRSSGRKAFNAPWGKYANFGGQTDLTHYKEIIGHWKFMVAGYEVAIATLQPDDFVLFDPPYDSEDGKAFTGYHGKFTSADQVKAAEMLGALNIPVVAFNASTVFIKEVYKDLGFEIQEVLVARSVSCKGNGRQAAPEIIATKNL
jgi:DNA adenine methylase